MRRRRRRRSRTEAVGTEEMERWAGWTDVGDLLYWAAMTNLVDDSALCDNALRTTTIHDLMLTGPIALVDDTCI